MLIIAHNKKYFSLDSIDNTDKKILQLLQKNGKLTHKELAQQLNLSITPIYERVKRLELTGYIEKYVAIVNKHKVGKSLMVFCNVSLKDHSKDALKNFQEEVSQRKEIMECYVIGVMLDFLLKIVVKDMDHYNQFIMNNLSGIPNISNLQSSFVLGEIKHDTVIDTE